MDRWPALGAPRGGPRRAVRGVVYPLVAVVLGGPGAAVVALATGPAMFRLRGPYFATGTLATTVEGRIIVVFVLPNGLYGFMEDRWDRPGRSAED